MRTISVRDRYLYKKCELNPIPFELKLGFFQSMCKISSNELFIVYKSSLFDTEPNKVCIYNLNTRAVVKMPHTIMHCQGYTLEYLDGYMYLIGYKDRSDYNLFVLHHSERFDLKNNKWEFLGYLHLPRHIIRTFTYKSKFYAYGYTDRRKLDTDKLEVFNEKNKRWELCYVPEIGINENWSVLSYENELLAFGYLSNTIIIENIKNLGNDNT